MNVLIACEESQRVCTAFRAKGHNAFSCDILPCSGGHPEWHIQDDVLDILNPFKHSDPSKDVIGISFCTMDGKYHFFEGKWDMIIAFPPCTHLGTSGARHFEKKRADGRQREAIEFFCQFLIADCPRVVIENPRGIISGGEYIKKHFPDLAEKYGLPVPYSQIVQPWWFAKDENDKENYHEKTTCLWCIGVDVLDVPFMEPPYIPPKRYVTTTGKSLPEWYCRTSMRGSGNRQVIRSKTFPGIAQAMAEQWG